ncbi:MAG: DUF4256 domain-containing protein [Candidatus Wallacebacter cryptica]|jgi:hypothetical protein|nr:DUF4256 domain-containing protein [Bacillota bacterium]
MTELLSILKDRFEKHMERHTGIKWEEVEAKLKASREILQSLKEMERTGGEPDVVEFKDKPGEILFVDCSPESPIGRRSLCYDQKARLSRKKNPPEGSALELAAAMGIEILTEEQYRYLQTLGAFDLKTSSWIKTPEKIRKLGGALFCDRRYDTVFVFHNEADSYYSSRGFRGLLRV